LIFWLFVAVLFAKIGLLYFDKTQISKYMSYKEQMNDWLSKHPDATPEEAYEAGWLACTEAWCHGKREKLEKLVQLMNDIIK
jgi:hypothetical protein